MVDKSKKKSSKDRPTPVNAPASKRSETLTDQIIDETYRVGRRIGAGSFGEIRIGTHVQTGMTVAIKLEKMGHNAQLQNEHLAYGLLVGRKGFPVMYHFGQFMDFQVLVIEMLGRDLESIFDKCGRRFTLKSMLFVTIQLLKRFEDIHQVGLLYRDVKPENFMLGANTNKVYVIDFGLCKSYKDSTGRHIPFALTQELIGTSRYMSVAAHQGNEQARKDDLESLGYVFAYFLRGKLPWSGLKARTPKEHNLMISNLKANTSEEKLMEGFPSEFTSYLKYVRAMEFETPPNYAKLRNMFKKLFRTNKFADDGVFDWNPQ